MTAILAIDQSTSATKAALFDPLGGVIDRASRDHRQIYPRPGWVEHDAEEIWQNVLAVVREIADRHADRLRAAAALSIANQRETIVVFDRRSGRPLSHAIVWQCRRGDAICRELSEAGHGDRIRERTGLKLNSYFPAPKLTCLLSDAPELAARLASGDALVGTIDAYLIYRLTRGAVFATDHTNASRTLLYDIDLLRWDEELCDLFGVPRRALPEVCEGFGPFGETEAEGALPAPLPIRGVMGDSQAALFAQRCYEAGAAKATFGTGTSLLLNVGHQRPPSCEGVVTALAWVRQGQPTYALEGIINYSSATIAWLKDQLGLIDDAAKSEALARTVDGCGGVYFVPAFSGLSAPYWNTEARAAIVGMTAYTRKEHVVRAALEAIAYQIRDVLEIVQAQAAARPSVLYADGGPTRNRFLMQFTADIVEHDLVVAELPEASAWGAAAAGLVGLGVYGSPSDLAAVPRETTTFRPRPGADEVRRLYSGWQAAVRRVL